MDTQKITDVVVDINDFLIVANMKHGGIHMGSHGGITMMLTSAVKEEKFLLKKFFRSIEGVEGITNLEHEIYYEGVPIPSILVDHLFDNDSDDNILGNIKTYLDENASWMEKNGLIAIAEMTFNTDMSSYYRMYNKENLRIVYALIANGYRVHLLGNCSRRSLDKIINVHGNLLGGHHVTSITTSTDLKSLKCSSGNNHDMVAKFLEAKKFNPESTLFIEINQGYIDAIRKYDDKIPTLLYRGKDEKVDFLKELCTLLNIKISYDDIKG